MLTGLELGSGALFTLGANPYYDATDPESIERIILLDHFKLDKASIGPFSDTIGLPRGETSITVSYSNSKPGSAEEWVVIESIGTYADEVGKEYSRSGKLWVQLENPQLTVSEIGD
jgi:hypothetical protein